MKELKLFLVTLILILPVCSPVTEHEISYSREVREISPTKYEIMTDQGPMIVSQECFEKDLARGLVRCSKGRMETLKNTDPGLLRLYSASVYRKWGGRMVIDRSDKLSREVFFWQDALLIAGAILCFIFGLGLLGDKINNIKH